MNLMFLAGPAWYSWYLLCEMQGLYSWRMQDASVMHMLSFFLLKYFHLKCDSFPLPEVDCRDKSAFMESH